MTVSGLFLDFKVIFALKSKNGPENGHFTLVLEGKLTRLFKTTRQDVLRLLRLKIA